LARLLAGIEAGGTKFVCAVGVSPDDIAARVEIPTTSPTATIAEAISFLARESAGDPVQAIGIASFGPIDVDQGRIVASPKRGWTDIDLLGPFRAAFNVPIVFETDVNGAAVGEALSGKGRGLKTFVYLTVGSGINGGGLVDGRVMHGLMHPEMGHMRVPHDLAIDPFRGGCPFHGDCWEGLASGVAIRERWGEPGEDLAANDEVWQLEARYLALGVVNITTVLSPERIILGGGVMANNVLLPLVRTNVIKLLEGYPPAVGTDVGIDEYLVTPGLRANAGIVGALALAQGALAMPST
jgi:fructokinase